MTLDGPDPVAVPLTVSGVELCSWNLPGSAGQRDRSPLLVMLHGMRDIARGLLPVAWPLSERFDVRLFDLRGHGESDYTGTYSVPQYYYDIYVLLTKLREQAPGRPLYLFGHSLGGQLAARCAGLFPELVDALVLAEGLGPPRPQWPQEQADEDAQISFLREQLLARFQMPAATRPLPDRAFAAQRLLINNPRLDPEQARLTARYATREAPDGTLRWAFDARVSTVFVGFDERDSARLWRRVRCPVLTITGDLADEYWRSVHPLADYTGVFQPGEYETRISVFRTVRHLRFEGSGHMVHFDEPERLAAETGGFLASLT